LKKFVLFYGNTLENFVRQVETNRSKNQSLPTVERIRFAENVVRNWIKWQEEKGYAPKSINQALAALQNFMQYYNLPLSFRFIEKPDPVTLKKNDKHRWSLEEVKQFVDSATYVRDKAFLLCQFQSGLGIGDLVELNYRDVRKELEQGKLPLLLNLIRKKTGVRFKTFFGRDAVHYLKLYLKSRQPLLDEDPLFTKLGSIERLTEGAIQITTRRLAEKMSFLDEQDLENGYNPARPHSIRAAFISRLTGKLDRVLIEFFAGHEIGEEKRAYLNIPEEELRELYANYEHLLAIEKTSKNELAGIDTTQRSEELLTRLETLQRTVENQAEVIASMKDERIKEEVNMWNILNELRKEVNELRARVGV
jgi:integrase/recombinase XerD